VKEDPRKAQTKLEDLLELLTLCDIWDMPGLRSNVTKAIIVDYELVRLENALTSKFTCLNSDGPPDSSVVAVLERAEIARADSLKDYCAKFVEDNSLLVNSCMAEAASESRDI
jgi:hypothetical protein